MYVIFERGLCRSCRRVLLTTVVDSVATSKKKVNYRVTKCTKIELARAASGFRGTLAHLPASRAGSRLRASTCRNACLWNFLVRAVGCSGTVENLHLTSHSGESQLSLPSFRSAGDDNATLRVDANRISNAAVIARFRRRSLRALIHTQVNK